MPFEDETGPQGQGPRTGRGRGHCKGNAAPGRFSSAHSFGVGRGGRRGLSWRNRLRAAGPVAGEMPAAVPPAPTRQQNIAALKTAISDLEKTLSEIKMRVERL